ncbi:MAG: glutamate-ammonia-ligase adenylyltransferase [Deltaproteobacteria bacterium]|nr:glutamate-ammonia-ligase adenylyltransferase [Deltaproteobacteria bacterium]
MQALRSACPQADEGLLQEHLERLDARYFSRFSEKEVCGHVLGLSTLGRNHPVEFLFCRRMDGSVECTVLAFDYPSEFSLITGLFAATGFIVQSGDVFTYRRAPASRRRIIDHFSGILDTPLSFERWSEEIRDRLGSTLMLLERGDDRSVAEAKHAVNEMVVGRLARLNGEQAPVLYPVQIEIDNRRQSCTRIRVVSEDTPAFLYALSNALTLHDILIEHVRIRTIHGRVEDRLDLTDLQGRKIEDGDLLDRLRFSVLLTKQFTYFLGKAPDPYRALSRFEHLLGEILEGPRRGEWLELFTNPRPLKDLARLLGASDFLWEDFLRLQYETLLPLLANRGVQERLAEPEHEREIRLRKEILDARTLEEKRERLNAFKDRELFLIDLDHILRPEEDLRTFARRLTKLAEQVTGLAAGFVYEDLAGRYGKPRTIAGLEARYALMGLGKLGGEALGYASDIELLFIYSDNGRTDGKERIGNAEFFDLLVRGVLRSIKTKREGIFHVDLRLRPHGGAGPLACSLEAFCGYYGQGGPAHAYERLSLVRLRRIGGDSALGEQVERIRDEIVYFSNSIHIPALRDLREKQFQEKTTGAGINAKFSPGGLVDLEYGVQMLQVLHGKSVPSMRTPRIHEALAALKEVKIVSEEECLQLVRAYDFLRRVINGMRMLRGSARDLFLPPAESHEFAHLARRMGYERGGPLDPAGQLRMDFETHSAVVRVFAERHFGPNALPGPPAGTVVDVLLSDQMGPETRSRILMGAGFRDPERAYVNLRALAGGGRRRDLFVRLALLACDVLARSPDPDMALNNWERILRSLASPEFHFGLLLSQPMRLEILMSILSGSQFLADTLVRNPGFLDWVVIPKNLHRMRQREEIEGELRRASRSFAGHDEWLNKLRRLRRREILRIGTRDMCLEVPTQEVMTELSSLAEACLDAALERAWGKVLRERGASDGGEAPGRGFCIMAMGKLGGRELNYSSDIDLLGVWADAPGPRGTPEGRHDRMKGLFTRVMEQVRSDLSLHTEEGYAYRVDLRLRPFGREGELVPALSGLISYYRERAALWEIQAAIKMRPVAGDMQTGYVLLEQLKPLLVQRRSRESIVRSIEDMRRAAWRNTRGRLKPVLDVKKGPGGLRDIEFLVQGLQLMYAADEPSLLEGNTLRSIELLEAHHIIAGASAAEIREDYLFLRRVEHTLQILEDRQIHALPSDPTQVDALARRVEGPGADGKGFLDRVRQCLTRVRKAHSGLLLQG